MTADDVEYIINMQEDFVAKLKSIPWFANLGKPIAPGLGVKQIHDWSEWPGPEDVSVSQISYRQQDLYMITS